MAFCTECGANVPNGLKFCISCGSLMEDGAQPAPALAQAAPQYTQAAVQPVYTRQQAQAYAPPGDQPPVRAVAGSDTPPPYGSKYAVMSTGSFIGHAILFSIPIIGLIACVVMTFTAKNQNKRNYTRAMLILLLIGIALSLVLYLMLDLLMGAIAGYLNEAAQGAFEGFGESAGILGNR